MPTTPEFLQDVARITRLYGRRRFILAPTPDECRAMLHQLLQDYGGERTLAEVLGPSKLTLQSWLTPNRNIDFAGRRLIWLVWALTYHPERCASVLDLVTWGQVTSKPRGYPREDWSI